MNFILLALGIAWIFISYELFKCTDVHDENGNVVKDTKEFRDMFQGRSPRQVRNNNKIAFVSLVVSILFLLVFCYLEIVL